MSLNGHRDGSHSNNQSSTIVIPYLPSTQYTSQSCNGIFFFLRITVPENKQLLNDVVFAQCKVRFQAFVLADKGLKNET